MRYLSVILWLLLGLLYYWIWSNGANTCCSVNGLSTTESVAPGVYDNDDKALGAIDSEAEANSDKNSKTDAENAAATAAKKEADAKAAAEVKRKADEAADKAIADAAKTKTVTSVKSVDAAGVNKLTFYFPYNSAAPKYSNVTESDLNEIVAKVKSSGKSVVISGHTDDRGPSDSNKNLGQWRADEVRNKLISKGLKKSQISARSFGEEKPIASNNSSEGRQKNRRVELIIE